MFEDTKAEDRGLNRADFLKRSGVAIGGVALGGVAATPSWARAVAHEAAATINIGIVSPLTGPESGFGEPDPYVVGLARHAFGKGLKIGGKHYSVKVIEKDSQSGPAAASSAQQLINSGRLSGQTNHAADFVGLTNDIISLDSCCSAVKR